MKNLENKIVLDNFDGSKAYLGNVRYQIIECLSLDGQLFGFADLRDLYVNASFSS